MKNLYNRQRNKNNREKEGQQITEDQQVPIKITNPELYNRIKNCINNKIEEVNRQRTEPRKRTKKLYSQEVNYDVIVLMNDIIQKENLDEKVQTRKQLNDLLYVCQLVYDEVTAKPIKPTDWKRSIQNKIAKFERQIEVIKNHKQEQTPSGPMKNICRSNKIHSNNNNQVEELKDRLEEKKAVYQKKIHIAEKRADYRKTNKMFEFNRRAFYRNLNEKKMEIDDCILGIIRKR